MSGQGAGAGRLIFELVTPGLVYHAAFVSGRARPDTPLHTHDFYEVFYMLEGAATHTINGQTFALAAGDLLFIRPEDCHALQTRAGKTFNMINVAFPAEPWECFCALAGLEEGAFIGTSAAPPPAVRVSPARRQECAAVFRRILHAFQQPFPDRPARQELCWFWSAVLEFLLPEREAMDQNETRPAWLTHACQAMREDENLQAGLSRFVEVSGVSRAHLTRTLKACCGQTPTAFLNELRLRRAALLLATTPATIIDVATDCGFEDLSYFYRRFRRQFGQSPRAWRLEARRIAIPVRELTRELA